MLRFIHFAALLAFLNLMLLVVPLSHPHMQDNVPAGEYGRIDTERLHFHLDLCVDDHDDDDDDHEADAAKEAHADIDRHGCHDHTHGADCSDSLQASTLLVVTPETTNGLCAGVLVSFVRLIQPMVLAPMATTSAQVVEIPPEYQRFSLLYVHSPPVLIA